MATQSSILTWGIPGTEKSGGLQSTGSQRIGHDLARYFQIFTFQSSQNPGRRGGENGMENVRGLRRGKWRVVV